MFCPSSYKSALNYASGCSGILMPEKGKNEKDQLLLNYQL